MLTFGSLFSGIGGFDLGFEQAGMKCAWQCEIDKRARSVLAAHWPNTMTVEDVRNVGTGTVGHVDLICGGFPCQDVSVAGKREGLAGERSGLWFEFRRVLDELRPQWVVIENVPGLLSSNKGRDFATILQGLVELRYGVSWRILDARGFGVPQRRKRVFIVGSLESGRSAEVLFERDCFQEMDTARSSWHGCLSTGNGSKLNFDGSCTLIHDISGYRIATPSEWERISGYPVGWTSGQKDTHRYHQLGNCVVPAVAQWIASRILALT